MSRRKLDWKRRAAQAGSVDKIMPRATKGLGMKMTTDVPGRTLPIPAPGEKAGSTVTVPMTTRKEALVRVWVK